MARQWLARASATLVTGAILFAGTPLFVAVGEAATSSTVNVGKVAVVRAMGAAVTIPVTVKCSPAPQFPTPTDGLPPVASERSVNVQVIQALGSSTTAGYGYASVTCDNTPHVVRVDVLVSSPGAPFRPGIAFAKADFYECGPSFCGTVSDADEIRIIRPL